MRLMILLLSVLLLFVADQSAASERERPTNLPAISISADVENGEKVLIATVVLGGNPLEGVQVAFYVERTFGLLYLGKDETLDDGTGAVPFPEGLPGGQNGELLVVATIKEPPQYAGVIGRAALPGGKIVSADEGPLPRALWAPRAPVPLILTIAVLVGGVWSTYGYVLLHLRKIAKTREG